MEARLYAEDPAKGFLPSVGRLERLEFGLAHRIETGVQQGATVSPFYDPMIAKVISHGFDRSEAIARLVQTLDSIEVWPIKTNAAFLRRAASHAEFCEARLDTGFIPRHEDQLIISEQALESEWQAAARFALADQPQDAAYLPSGFRLNAATSNRVTLASGSETRTLEPHEASLVDTGFGSSMVLVGNEEEAHGFTAMIDDDLIVLFGRGRAIPFGRAVRSTGHHSAHDGDILSPMPGKVIAVEVSAGQAVTKGQKLLTLEAMKMEHTLVAPFDGVVAELSATAGAQVQVEALLARIEAGDA
jgi:3-methylcrotonyl-CoA carboxylase alpha subunit